MNLGNVRSSVLQAGLEEQVQYPTANLGESWGCTVSGSSVTLPKLKPLALTPGI